MSGAADVGESARAAAESLQQLCRATLSRPSMTPAEVDVVLGHLVAALAALPQAARQLGDILEQATHHLVLEMDTLTETTDPALAIQTARSYLDALGEPAHDMLRQLDAARNETAHISADPTPQDAKSDCRSTTPLQTGTAMINPASSWMPRRPEDRQPPIGGGGTGPGVAR